MIQWLQNYSGTGIHGENFEKNELENLRKELKYYRKKFEKEMKDIEIISEDDESIGQEEQKKMDEEMKKKQQKKKYKRATISDEVISLDEISDNINRNINKEQIENLSEKFKEKIQSLFFFKNLTPIELDQVLSSFQIEQIKKGEAIFNQGEDADKLYIIDKGELTCWKTIRPEDPPTFIKILKEGDSFGELALMYNYIRNYTIKAKSDDVILYSLDRRTFKLIIQGDIQEERKRIKDIISKVDILSTLNNEEISKIIDIIEEREYKEGDDIIKQNGNEDDFIILYDGKCHSDKISDSGKTQPLLKYEPFDFFGEVPFFKSEIRNYIVKADTDCHVLVINKKEFKRLVGTLENILKRKNEIYQKYMKK